MPRCQYKFHFIYKVTCLLNGKFYVGMHSTSDMNDGYMGSGKRIRYSLNKHGISNHKIEYLEFFENRIDLKKREAELVNESLLQDPLCVNLKVGGEGGWEHIIRDPNKDRELIRFAQKRHKWLMENDAEFYAKFCERRKQAALKREALGIRHLKPFTGHHSEETKRKMSESHRGLLTGQRNPCFGLCWIYHPEQRLSKRIPKDELESAIKDGWLKGRKMF